MKTTSKHSSSPTSKREIYLLAMHSYIESTSIVPTYLESIYMVSTYIHFISIDSSSPLSRQESSVTISCHSSTAHHLCYKKTHPL